MNGVDVGQETERNKQQPSMLPGPAVRGCCLVSFRLLCDIHSIDSVLTTTFVTGESNCTTRNNLSALVELVKIVNSYRARPSPTSVYVAPMNGHSGSHSGLDEGSLPLHTDPYLYPVELAYTLPLTGGSGAPVHHFARGTFQLSSNSARSRTRKFDARASHG